ncbi:MAG TPA: GntR family transcriptional regulator, partial [Phycisphaeraceae bacterium]
MSVKRSSRGRRERLSVDDCEQHIIEAICSGEIEPSQRLGEVSVARELGVGQAHVRAAFDRLAYAGILDRRHRSGTYVREISLREFIEMTQVRALLEGFACRLACGHATESDLAPLERLGRELDQRLAKLTPDQYRQIERMDLDFHQRIVELSRSSVLKRIL